MSLSVSIKIQRREAVGCLKKGDEKALLNLKEFCEYLGIGETKAREMLKQPRNGFAIKIGSKWFAHKGRLDAWLLNECDRY